MLNYPRWRAALTFVIALTLGTFRAQAIIDVSLQMQLGNPSGATADPNNQEHYLIQRSVEAIDYNNTLGEPNWASWDLTAADLGSSGRSPDFVTDSSLPPSFYEVTTDDYGGSGYDRGHMCPSADRTDNDSDNLLVFLMSNIIPQSAANNQGVWAGFESYCRSLAQSGNELLIICGPSGFNGSLIKPSYRVQIPAYTWKIVVVVPLGAGTALTRISAATRVIAIKVPNTDSVGGSWQSYVTSARQIEADTGYTFFTTLPTNVAEVLRDKVDGLSAAPPVIAGFSPATSAVYSNVVITGANFSAASAVTVHGVATAFTINSSTQITALVPLNAATGPVSVTIPTGTAVTTSNLVISGSTVDLSVQMAHFGNFSQGDTGDTYIINVTNAGTMPSAGFVTVSNLLPAGLVATAISGVGWNVNLATRVCTRSNSLFAGAAYPPITLTVNVATNAPAAVTNIALVSISSDANAANNTARDNTVINPSVITGEIITLAGWNVSGLPGGANNFGPSPFSPTTNAPDVVAGGLTRGSGVGISGTGAARGWGGNGFVGASASAAVANSQYVTFQVAATQGHRVSFSSIGRFDYRRSNTGPQNGVLQYQIGSGPFIDITSLTYSSGASTGDSLSPVNLSGVPGLQNVGGGSNVTFRIVNYGGGSSGTWYVFDTASSSAPDLEIRGSISSTNQPDLIVALAQPGSFTQGDIGDTYSINVTNIGGAATLGLVTVVASPPAGFTITALGGAGWLANLATLTCTRSESLSAGAAYPPITVVVDIATNAAASLTNRVTVSGGGELNTANDSASSLATVIPLTPVQLWRLYWFGTVADNGSAADSFVATSDGMANLLKYAIGLDPLVPATNPIVGDVSTGYLRITLPRNPAATDVTMAVEGTVDLNASWTTNGIVVDQNGPALFQAHFGLPVESAPTRFLRVHVTRP